MLAPVAVKVTLVPEQIELEGLATIETVGVRIGFTVISTLLFTVMSTALIRVIVTVVVPEEANELVGTIKVRVPADVPDIPIDILVAVFAPLKE